MILWKHVQSEWPFSEFNPQPLANTTWPVGRAHAGARSRFPSWSYPFSSSAFREVDLYLSLERTVLQLSVCNILDRCEYNTRKSSILVLNSTQMRPRVLG